MNQRTTQIVMVTVLVAVSCAGSQPATDTGRKETSALTGSPAPQSAVLDSMTSHVEGSGDEPPEFTEFTSSTACDPYSDEDNLQVVEAFVNAYNQHDEDRLAELFSDSVIVDDLSGLPHLRQDSWADVRAWANEGWEVDDRFELTRLVMYDGGALFDLVRSNDILRANHIEELRHLAKTHSSRCLISRLVLYLPSGEDPTAVSGKRSPASSPNAPPRQSPHPNRARSHDAEALSG